MQNIAQPWLALKLTDSAFLLSLVSAMQFLPVMLFSLFAGAFIERLPKKNLLIFTQSVFLFITLMLAILTYSGQIQYWHLLIAAASLGVVNTFDMPTRQSFVIELVGKEDLMNAIALNSTTFNASRIIGSALAGLIMGKFGTAACFLANSISFTAVLCSLFFIKPILRAEPKKVEKIFKNIKDGLIFIKEKRILLEAAIIMTVVGIFGPNFSVLVPVFTKQVLKQQEAGYGFLMSMMGIGSLAGALFIAAISKTGPKKIILFVVPFIIGLSLIIVGLTSVFIVTALFLIITGFFFVIFTSNSNSTMQLNATNEYRGRVMSVYTLVFAGTSPIGSIYAGKFADKFGARIGFFACGGAIILLMLIIYIFIFIRRRHEVL